MAENAGQYEVKNLRKPQHIADVGREVVGFHHLFGVDISRRGNLSLIEDHIIVYAIADAVVFENIFTQQKQYLLGIDEGGVGCVTVNPSRALFAVGGKGFQPNIYVYNYPEMKIQHVLSGGAERGFAYLTFNAAGTMLASLSTSPDFMLTVWNWKEERIALHSKAFGQDVFSVRFSLDDERRLTTSGTGHIRFWKMAATFTGLKLQGYIGKFGKVELSDIDAFVELPDGKVISGTESGALLLWEGNFIKCRFVQIGGAPCHAGDVSYCELDRLERCLITAGVDGYIRWWNFDAIDTAEVDSDVSMDFELLPIAEYRLPDGAGVKTVVDGGVVDESRSFIVVDDKGHIRLVRFPLKTPIDYPVLPNTAHPGPVLKLSEAVYTMKHHPKLIEPTVIFTCDFHSGSISGMDTCPIGHFAVTGGVDKTLRLWDYSKRTLMTTRAFSHAITTVRWVPLEVAPEGNQILAGFADGIVRLFRVCLEMDGDCVFKRMMVFKPHNAPVLDMAFSPTTSVLATTGKDGIIFFLNCKEFDGPKESWTPLRFVTISAGGVKAPVSCESMTWSDSSSELLCSCTDGSLREIDVRDVLKSSTTADGIHSYEAFFKIKEIVAYTPSSLGAATAAAAAPAAGDGAAAAATAATAATPDGDAAAAEEAQLIPMKINSAIYVAVDKSSPKIIATAASVQKQPYLVEFVKGSDVPAKALPVGVYSADGKDSRRPPTLTSLRYSWSKRFVVSGAADGSVIVRPDAFNDTFLRVAAHNGTCGGVTAATTSFDDRFLLSAGKDGSLAVYRLRLEMIMDIAEPLYKDLDAGVFGGALLKPTPAVIPDEPSFLTVVYNDDELNQVGYFEIHEQHLSASAPNPVLKAVEPTEEFNDLAPNAYSIQDAKLKSEEDARRIAAEELKDKVRANVVSLQKEFQSIRNLNNSLPVEVRLSEDEMAVDGEYLDILKSQGDALVEEVHKECAYEAEKAALLRSKIKNRLKGGILVDEMPLYAFTRVYGRSRPFVKSIRTQGIAPEVHEILNSVQRLVKQEELEEANLRANEMAKKKAVAAINEMQDRINKKEGLLGASSKDGDGGAAAVRSTSAAARGARRKQRKATIASHEKEKPSENDDDERDIVAIREAERTMGDFKLKCADDYEVPEEQRVNAAKKCRQMALLEESMVTMRLQFNERFLALRDLKRQLVSAIRRDNARIRQIDSELRQTHLSFGDALWEPKLDPDEFPDDMDEITEAELQMYIKDRESTPWIKVVPPKHSVITGTKTTILKDALSGSYETRQKVLDGTLVDRSVLRVSATDQFFADPPAVVDMVPPRVDEPKIYEVRDEVLTSFGGPANFAAKASLEEIACTMPILIMAKEAKSKKMAFSMPTEEQEAAIRERSFRLEFERKMLLEKMEENVKEFDEAINDLRFDRHAIVSDLKLTELKLIVMYQEYQMLQTFESKDIALQQKQLRCMGEKSEIAATSAENKSKLDGKLEELAQWTEKTTQILQELKSMLPDNNPFAEILTKIFKKKIKRKKMGEDGEEDEEEEEEEDDDEEEEEEVDDACPPGCDPNLHEKVLDLREKRLDTEEVSSEIQKTVDDLKKTIERLKQREKQIIKDTQQAELEMQQFQLQKQAALNQIEVVVPIRISQLYPFTTSGCLTVPSDQSSAKELAENDPDLMSSIEMLKDSASRSVVDTVTMNSHVLVNRKTLQRLDKRINELHVECSESRANFQELHKERVRLSKERENQKEEIEKWQQRCKELQMLKFGRVIDLDELEADADRSKEEEAEQSIVDIEGDYVLKTQKLAKEIEELQSSLADTTKKNTELLQMVGELTESKLEITRELNSSEGGAAQESQVDEYRDMEDRRRIATFVEIQARELDALRAELFMLKRKDASTIMMPSIPLPAPPQGGGSIASQKGQRAPGITTLPPIPGSKK